MVIPPLEKVVSGAESQTLQGIYFPPFHNFVEKVEKVEKKYK
jgi:hypothetical protein